MSYNKTNWVDFETKLTAANLNKIENGLKEASDKADSATNTISAWGASTGPVGKVPGLLEDVGDHEVRLNTLEVDIYTEDTGILDRLESAESDLSNLEQRVSDNYSTHGGQISGLNSATSAHYNNKNNPHGVTASQVGAFSKTEINTLLSPCTKELTSATSDTTLTTVSGSDLSTGEQNIIITPIKAVTASNTEYEYSDGQNAMWYLTGLLSGNEVNTDRLNSFSSLLSNFSYDIINIAEDGSTICGANNYPVNYISDMQYVDPTYVVTSNGWALPGSDNMAAGAFVTIIMYSPLQHKYFLIPTGFNYVTYEHLGFYFLDNRYLLVHGNCVYKHSIDLTCYGNDIEFFSLGFNALNDAYTTTFLTPVEAHCASFTLTDNNGNSIIPTTYVTTSAQEYVFNINPSSSNYTLGFQGYGQQYLASLRMQYARNDSANLIRLGKNIPTNQEELDKDLDIKVKRALSDLISTGTGDPDASTPGLLYFKYLL